RDLEVSALPQPTGLLFCRAGHPLLERAHVDWAALLDYPLATTRLPQDIEQQLAARTAPFGGLKRRIQCDNVAMLVSIVRQSQAISLAPAGAIERELAAGTLVTLEVEDFADIQTHYAVVQRRGRSLSPAARHYVDMLREQTGGVGEVVRRRGRRRGEMMPWRAGPRRPSACRQTPAAHECRRLPPRGTTAPAHLPFPGSSGWCATRFPAGANAAGKFSAASRC